MHPYPSKEYNITRRVRNHDEVEKYFPGFMAFIDSTEQQIPRSVYKRRKNYTIKTQFMVNKNGTIIHKVGYKKGKRHGYNIY